MGMGGFVPEGRDVTTDKAALAEMERKLERYDEAMRLISDRLEDCTCAMPKPCDAAEIIEAIGNDIDNVDGWCDLCRAEAAFLAEDGAK